jgi:transcriptional regulator with XRE-family HTH domain
MEDEFGSYLDEATRDPEFRAAYEDEVSRHKLIDSLVRLRVALGFSQSDVARRMGVKQPTVSGFENESSDPKVSTVQRYARAVGARVSVRVEMPAECDWVTPGTSGYRRDVSGVINVPQSKVTEGGIAKRWMEKARATIARPEWTLGA